MSPRTLATSVFDIVNGEGVKPSTDIPVPMALVLLAKLLQQ